MAFKGGLIFRGSLCKDYSEGVRGGSVAKGASTKPEELSSITRTPMV